MTYAIDELSGVVNYSPSGNTSLADQITALQKATSVVTYTAAGAISPTGIAVLKAGSAAAMTLVVPPTGANLTIVAADAHAYTVTTSANKVNGNSDTLTWTAAVGNSITLVGSGGIWYVALNTGVALSEV